MRAALSSSARPPEGARGEAERSRVLRGRLTVRAERGRARRPHRREPSTASASPAASAWWASRARSGAPRGAGERRERQPVQGDPPVRGEGPSTAIRASSCRNATLPCRPRASGGEALVEPSTIAASASSSQSSACGGAMATASRIALAAGRGGRRGRARRRARCPGSLPAAASTSVTKKGLPPVSRCSSSASRPCGSASAATAAADSGEVQPATAGRSRARRGPGGADGRGRAVVAVGDDEQRPEPPRGGDRGNSGRRASPRPPSAGPRARRSSGRAALAHDAPRPRASGAASTSSRAHRLGVGDVEERAERAGREQSVAGAPEDPRGPPAPRRSAAPGPSCRRPPRPPMSTRQPPRARRGRRPGTHRAPQDDESAQTTRSASAGELTANARMGARHDLSAPVPMMHTVSGTCKLCCFRTRWAWCQAAFCHVLRCRAQPHPFGAAPLDAPHRLVSLEPEFALKAAPIAPCSRRSLVRARQP